jgi:uroporphyrinogen-III synthase
MRRILHLGLSIVDYFQRDIVIHTPIISLKKVEPSIQFLERAFDFSAMLITSKSTVEFFLKPYKKYFNPSLKIFSIGEKTSFAIKEAGFSVFQQAKHFTQEGLMEVIEPFKDKDWNFLFPRSNLARKEILRFFESAGMKMTSIICYETVFNPSFELIDLSQFDAIFFSCPSSVKFFFEKYPEAIINKEIIAIGEITYREIVNLNYNYNNKVNVIYKCN